MICRVCEEPSSFRFCSDACFVSYSKSRNEECQVCQYDHITGRIGNANARGICSDCRASEENDHWSDPSELEQTSDDVDVTVAVAGGDRLESVYGGRRKFDTPLARRVVRIAVKNRTRKVWRSREVEGGPQQKRRKRVERGLSLRQIAKKARCSVEYVRLVLNWMSR